MSTISAPADGDRGTNAVRQPPGRVAKRVRGNSDSSDIPEIVRVVVSRNVTPPTQPSSPTPTRPSSPTPSETEMSTATGAASDADSAITTLVNRRRKTMLRRINADDPQAELEACIRRIKTSKSGVYEHFENPVLDDADPHTHYIFVCKSCAHRVKRVIGVSETALLKYHRDTKCTSAKQASLGDFGVVGSSLRLTPEEVREYFALWVAESARPFAIVRDNQLRRLLHKDAREHIPHRATISRDVQTIYEATQKDITKMLANTPGAFHIALDLCQTPNAIDVLGLVLFHQSVVDSRTMVIKRFVLECLNFDSAHTGVALAKTVHAVLCKFKIEDRVWAVVCDNASNNGSMMNKLASYGMKRLNGSTSRSFCMAHVLNLAAQSVLVPFRKAWKLLREASEDAEDDDEDDEGELLNDFGLEHDPEDEDADPDDDGAGWVLVEGKDEDEELPDIVVPEFVKGSAEAQEAERFFKVHMKISRFAKRIRFSRPAKAEFKAACIKENIGRPHNVRRDMVIRWNSSELMLEDADRTFPAIMASQQAIGIPAPFRLKKEDRKVIRGLISVLKPLRNVTEALSRAQVPLIADVIPHYDALTHDYDSICADDNQPLFIRQAANRARTVLNKHYGNTDQSELYRLAMLFHPSLRVGYLRFAKWEEEWIDTAVEIAVDVWEEHYKPRRTTAAATTTDATASSQFAYSSYMHRMIAATGNTATQQTQDCPVHEFVYGKQVFGEGGGTLVNPISWWHGQRVLGNEFNGLTQLALDVLSAPATSVDVERVFSFVGLMINKRRHRLSPCTIQATASLGSYMKAGLVRRGILSEARAESKAKKAKKAGPSTADKTKSASQVSK